MSRNGEEGGLRCWPCPNKRPVFVIGMFSRGRMKLGKTISLRALRAKQRGIHKRLMFPDSLHVMSAAACEA